MKPLCSFIIAMALLSGSMSKVCGSVILDSFTDPSFAIDSSNPAIYTNLSLQQIADQRLSEYLGPVSYAYLTQSSNAGTLNLRLSLRGDPPPQLPATFRLTYRNSNFAPLSLLGLDYAVISVSSVTGLGDFRLRTGPGPESELFPITSAGTYLIPIPYNEAGIPRNTVSAFNVEVLGRSAAFAVTLDEISLVPEYP